MQTSESTEPFFQSLGNGDTAIQLAPVYEPTAPHNHNYVTDFSALLPTPSLHEEGRARHRKMALMSDRWTNKQTAGPAGQRQPGTSQDAQIQTPHCELVERGPRITNAFLVTARTIQQDAKKEAVVRATAGLKNARR